MVEEILILKQPIYADNRIVSLDNFQEDINFRLRKDGFKVKFAFLFKDDRLMFILSREVEKVE